MGPFPEDEDGNKYVINIIDSFTRFLEMYPMKDVSAKSAAKALLQHSGRYGFPSYLLSDQGTQFVNETITALTTLMGVTQILTAPYSKQENAIVERANREVLRHLRAILYDKRIQSDWSAVLPMVQRIINSEVHESIGVAPAALLFGNLSMINNGLLTVPDNARHSMSLYMDKLMTLQKDVMEIALRTQLASQREHLDKHLAQDVIRFAGTKYEPMVGQVNIHYPIGTNVLVQQANQAIRTGGKSKLNLPWVGPMTVTNVNYTSPNTYEVLNLVTGKTLTRNVEQLRPFVIKEGTNPVEIAVKDGELYIVEAILQAKGTITNKEAMTFQIKWLNSEDLTWEPWANMKDNAVFHEYLRSRSPSLARYIPARIRTASDIPQSLATPKPETHGVTQDPIEDLMLPKIRGRIAPKITDFSEDSSLSGQLPSGRFVTQAAPPIPRTSGRAVKAPRHFDER